MASLHTITGSLNNSFDTGFNTPFDDCTTPMEFSQLTNCSTPSMISLSLLPRQGRINASLPCTRWLRFNLVDTCTVRLHFFNADAVYCVSGVAERKLPPMPMKTFTFPAYMASIL